MQKKNTTLWVGWPTVGLIVITLLMCHFLIVPLLAVGGVMTGLAMGSSMMVLVGVLMLLLFFFMLPLIGLLTIVGLLLVGVVLGLVFFPLLLPLVFPVVIVALCLSYRQRCRCQKRRYDGA